VREHAFLFVCELDPLAVQEVSAPEALPPPEAEAEAAPRPPEVPGAPRQPVPPPPLPLAAQAYAYGYNVNGGGCKMLTLIHRTSGATEAFIANPYR